MQPCREFEMLHRDVQRWIYSEGFAQLREIQIKAIPHVLAADADVVISASTASGKTEAAFLPACSKIAQDKPQGIGILYLSPLKALINDQQRRIERLGDCIGVPVTPWHGDVLQSLKDKQKQNPSGILLTTPESLEAMLMRSMGWCLKAFSSLCYIIIDEFHAFIGLERGRQMQSLLHRIEFLVGRKIPRIALSATLENMACVVSCLRPRPTDFPQHIIVAEGPGRELRIKLTGYRSAAPDASAQDAQDHAPDMAADLYKTLRGKTQLVFSNSRASTEELAAKLAKRCAQEGMPNEFFPHHGSLSQDLRESLETRLREGKLPTSAVCTVTLELGIDIGSVDAVALVAAPHSVASLRQRVGRSGRRDKPSILRLYIAENAISDKTHLSDRLRLETVQCLAAIHLLLKKGYEPAQDDACHLSTLIQQTLSIIAQYGGVRATQLYALLCDTGPFRQVSQKQYISLLRSLGEQDLIIQMGDGQLTLGTRGEKLVGHYTFYAAFMTPEEYRLECDGKILGTIPFSNPLIHGQNIIFAGKYWTVLAIDDEKKWIKLARGHAGSPPRFDGSGMRVHDIIRMAMREIYINQTLPPYLDATAIKSVTEGMETFHALGLAKTNATQIGTTLHVLPWCGDRITSTLAMMFRYADLKSDYSGGIIDISDCTLQKFSKTIENFIKNGSPTAEMLVKQVKNTIVQKHDKFLPSDLREFAYAKEHFDVEGAIQSMIDMKI